MDYFIKKTKPSVILRYLLFSSKYYTIRSFIRERKKTSKNQYAVFHRVSSDVSCLGHNRTHIKVNFINNDNYSRVYTYILHKFYRIILAVCLVLRVSTIY